MTEVQKFIEVASLTDEALLTHFYGAEATLMLESYGSLANVVREAQPQYSVANRQLHIAMELVKRVNLARTAARVKLTNIQSVADYLRAHVAGLEHEVFIVLWLDAQMQVIGAEEMFRGTLVQTSVYPREIVKRALQINACCVICAHNHPSGSPAPSPADKALTKRLTEALELVDVTMVDHIIIADAEHFSFVQHGLLKPLSRFSSSKR
jgi:DNA repair protein RadC